jgi:predicted ArsR family transcriptional regulator/TusA-related sulfurtransferase
VRTTLHTADADETPDADAVQRALAVPTRAGIYRRLRSSGEPMSAREAAEAFGLHANVARSHLDVLADAGLVVTGQRKQPAGGRPAKVYVAREQAVTGRPNDVPTGSQLAVATVVQLIAGLHEHEGRLELLAEQQGRRLVDAAGGRADRRPFGAAAVVAVEALRRAFPEARVEDEADDHVHVAGLEIALKLIGEVDGRVGDALARGFLRGAISAAGAPTVVTSKAGRVRATLDDGGLGDHPTPDQTLDVRGRTYAAGVDAAVLALEPMRPGGHLEILTDLAGAPAAFARWADRAGHLILDVTRVRDVAGTQAVRLLLRKAAA